MNHSKIVNFLESKDFNVYVVSEGAIVAIADRSPDVMEIHDTFGWLAAAHPALFDSLEVSSSSRMVVFYIKMLPMESPLHDECISRLLSEYCRSGRSNGISELLSTLRDQ